MSARHITQPNLQALVDELLAAGTRVGGPARPADAPVHPITPGGVADYRWLQRSDELALNGPLPRRSAKEFFLPPTEELLRYRQKKGQVALEPASTAFSPRVLLGLRPCDAAGSVAMDRVMGWDYQDEFWFGRRKATVVIGLACPGVDATCFCTAVGLGPDSRTGSDLFLVPVTGGYLVEVVTPAGEAFLKEHAARFGDALAVAPEAERFMTEARRKIAGNLEPIRPAARAWLEANFEHPYWNTIAQRCHGCGACAAVCPTCHCFDIIDEADGIDRGVRRRNWDTCQTALFTVHGSGHNPRANQNARFRQRVLHKFAIYPRKFQDTILCTGCGRCVRACPGSMDLVEILSDINRLSVAGQPQQV